MADRTARRCSACRRSPPTTISADADAPCQRRLINCSLRRSRSPAVDAIPVPDQRADRVDGSEHFCSRKIKCPQRSTRRRADSAPNTSTLSSVPAWSHPRQAGLATAAVVHCAARRAEKQYCERNAAKRSLAQHGATVAHLLPVYLGDYLFACQPIVSAVHDASATSSSPASRLRIKPSPSIFTAPNCKNIETPSASAASAPPPSTAVCPRAAALHRRCYHVNWFSI